MCNNSMELIMRLDCRDAAELAGAEAITQRCCGEGACEIV